MQRRINFKMRCGARTRNRTSTRNKAFKLSKTSLIGYSSLGMLGLLSLAMLLPVSSTDTHAEAITDTLSTGVNTNVSALVRSSISIGVSSKVNLDLTPSSKGSFSSGIANLSISTNNTTGYSIYLRTPDDTASLLPAQSGVEQTIGRVNGTMSEDNYASNLNTWGYSISNTKEATSVDNTLYQAIPLSSDPAILSQDTTDQEDNYTLSLGVAISPTLPAGMYTNELIVSVVAHPIEVRSLSDITTMQEMTPEICKISYENETKQLIDTRDGNSYWVSKLADGNCWMVQNLALDITEAGLKAADTDITEDWNQSSEYPPTATKSEVVAGLAEDEIVPTTTYAWNLGKYVLATPFQFKRCNYTNSLANCGASGFIDVSGEKWQPNYTAQAGKITLDDGTEYEGLVAADNDNFTYDAHYLVGNYYQLNAATAGTSNISTSSKGASSSICPKGWKLPLSGSKNYDASGSFAYLFQHYVDKGFNIDGINMNLGVSEVEVLAGQGYNVVSAPFYMTFGGRILLSSAKAQGLGHAGYRTVFWSSTLSTADDTLAFVADAEESILVHLSERIKRTYGYSVRCIAR